MIKIDEILASLPHRYPMLLVDRVLELEPLKHCLAVKNVTINEPFFQGHYPGLPIMPGVLIVESLAQAGCMMIMHGDENRGRIPVIGAIDNVKFKRPVVPGDQMVLDVTCDWLRGPVGKITGKATIDGEVACQMEMTFKLLEKQS